MMYMGIAGIEPVEPGFARFRIRPQPADLRRLEFAVPAPSGTLRFRCEGSLGKRALTITAPERAEGDLILDARESTGLTPLADPVPAGTRSYRITRGATLSLTLTHT
jgi:alpha-L-rhamnosidase